MAKKDIRTYSSEDLKAMRARGEVRKTPTDAPTIKLSEAFWRKARLVETRPKRKASVHLRLDPETLAFYRTAGKGHLTRMANILKTYAEVESQLHNRTR